MSHTTARVSSCPPPHPFAPARSPLNSATLPLCRHPLGTQHPLSSARRPCSQGHWSPKIALARCRVRATIAPQPERRLPPRFPSQPPVPTRSALHSPSPPPHAPAATLASTFPQAPSSDSSSPSSFTVDDALTLNGFGPFQWMLLGYTGLAWASEAMELLLLSFIGPSASAEWGLQAAQESLLSSVVFGGMLVGAYGWGMLADSKGRRLSFVIAALFTAIAGLASSAAPSFEALLLARVLVGVGLGGAPVVFSLFTEFVPPRDRGFWLIGMAAFWTVGSVAEASLAWAVLPTLGWRWLVALSASPFLLLLLLFPFLPESPRYFLSQSRPKDALAILDRVARLNGGTLPEGELACTLGVERKEAAAEGGALHFPETHHPHRHRPPCDGVSSPLPRGDCNLATSSSSSGEAGEPMDEAARGGRGRRGARKQRERGIGGPSLEEFGMDPDILRGMELQPVPVLVDSPALRVYQSTASLASPRQLQGCTPASLLDRSGYAASSSTGLMGPGPGRLAAPVQDSREAGAAEGGAGAAGWQDSLAEAWAKHALLFSERMCRTTMLLWGVFFANAFTYYGLVLLTTQLATGAGAVPGADAGSVGLVEDSFRDILVTSAGELPGLLLAMALVDRVGRKNTMASLLAASGLCALALLATAAAQSGGGDAELVGGSPTLVLLFLARAFVMGSFQTVYLYAPEVYPTAVRSTGLGAASAFSRLGGVVCPFVAVNLVQGGHQDLSLWIFGVVPLLAAVGALAFPVETSKKGLSE